MSAIAARIASTPRLLARIEALRPRYVLGGLIVVQWLFTLGLALSVQRNGWLFYQGGDQLWHYVTAWVMAHGRLPHTSVGYAWSMVLFPFAVLGGPNLMSVLPFVVLFNVLVLMPVAMIAAYGIGTRIGGRLFGYWVAALWIVVPLVGIKFTDAGYHQRYTELLLPQSLGLTAMSDFPSMVVSVVAAYFALRAAQDDAPWDGALAGLFAGVAIGIKPSNAPLLVGIGLALLAMRRWRSTAWLGAAFAPSLAMLAWWKARGEGTLPLFHSASGSPPALLARIAPVLGVSVHIGRYIHPSWSYFDSQLKDLEQHFWSVRLLEWLALAGAIGLFRKSRPAGLLVAGWFFANIFAKWTTPGRGTIADSDLLRQSIPTIPAALLLVAGVILLFPGLPQRLRQPASGPWGTQRLRIGILVAGLVVFAVVPAALASLPRLSDKDTISYYTQSGPSLSAPFSVDSSWRPHLVLEHGGKVEVTWPALRPSGGTMTYEVIRALAGSDLTCGATIGAAQCRLLDESILPTRSTHLTDHVGPGRFVYRIAGTASWTDEPTAGNIYVISAPVTLNAR